MKKIKTFAKKIFILSKLIFLPAGLAITGCKKNNCLAPLTQNQVTYEPEYSSLADFVNGLKQVDSVIKAQHVIAFLDTLSNGYPNVAGRKTLLSEFSGSILNKLNSNQVESGVNDVFHFDGSSFSLISFLIKAYLAGCITLDELTRLLSLIPLPPIPMDNFDPPMKPEKPVVEPVTCSPKVNLFINMGFDMPGGHYKKFTSDAWAPGNQLNNMSRNELFKVYAETNCTHGGSWRNDVMTTIPNFASIDGKEWSHPIRPGWVGGNSISFISPAAGTATISCTYTCGVTGAIGSASFTVNFR